MTPKQKAEELVRKFEPLVVYWDCYNDAPMPSEDILVDAKQCAIIAVENEYHSLREQLFNLKSCSVDIPEKVYLFRIQALIDEEQEVKQEIKALWKK